MQRKWLRELMVRDLCRDQPGTRDLGTAPELEANPCLVLFVS
jgi:hypothetical protein